MNLFSDEVFEKVFCLDYNKVKEAKRIYLEYRGQNAVDSFLISKPIDPFADSLSTDFYFVYNSTTGERKPFQSRNIATGLENKFRIISFFDDKTTGLRVLLAKGSYEMGYFLIVQNDTKEIIISLFSCQTEKRNDYRLRIRNDLYYAVDIIGFFKFADTIYIPSSSKIFLVDAAGFMNYLKEWVEYEGADRNENQIEDSDFENYDDLITRIPIELLFCYLRTIDIGKLITTHPFINSVQFDGNAFYLFTSYSSFFRIIYRVPLIEEKTESFLLPAYNNLFYPSLIQLKEKDYPGYLAIIYSLTEEYRLDIEPKSQSSFALFGDYLFFSDLKLPKAILDAAAIRRIGKENTYAVIFDERIGKEERMQGVFTLHHDHLSYLHSEYLLLEVFGDDLIDFIMEKNSEFGDSFLDRAIRNAAYILSVNDFSQGLADRGLKGSFRLKAITVSALAEYVEYNMYNHFFKFDRGGFISKFDDVVDEEEKTGENLIEPDLSQDNNKFSQPVDREYLKEFFTYDCRNIFREHFLEHSANVEEEIIKNGLFHSVLCMASDSGLPEAAGFLRWLYKNTDSIEIKLEIMKKIGESLIYPLEKFVLDEFRKNNSTAMVSSIIDTLKALFVYEARDLVTQYLFSLNRDVFEKAADYLSEIMYLEIYESLLFAEFIDCYIWNKSKLSWSQLIFDIYPAERLLNRAAEFLYYGYILDKEYMDPTALQHVEEFEKKKLNSYVLIHFFLEILNDEWYSKNDKDERKVSETETASMLRFVNDPEVTRFMERHNYFFDFWKEGYDESLVPRKIAALLKLTEQYSMFEKARTVIALVAAVYINEADIDESIRGHYEALIITILKPAFEKATGVQKVIYALALLKFGLREFEEIVLNMVENEDWSKMETVGVMAMRELRYLDEDRYYYVLKKFVPLLEKMDPWVMDDFFTGKARKGLVRLQMETGFISPS